MNMNNEEAKSAAKSAAYIEAATAHAGQCSKSEMVNRLGPSAFGGDAPYLRAAAKAFRDLAASAENLAAVIESEQQPRAEAH